jgi:hypothetical protein
MRLTPATGPIVLAGIGLALLATGLVLMFRELSFGKRAVQAQGTIVDVWLPRGKKSSPKARIPVVEFTVSGRTIRFAGTLEANDWPEKLGQPIAILYDPADPDNASLDDGIARFAGCAAWMLMGTAILTGAAIMAFRIRRG